MSKRQVRAFFSLGCYLWGDCWGWYTNVVVVAGDALCFFICYGLAWSMLDVNFPSST